MAAHKKKKLESVRKAPKLHEVHPNHLILGIVIGAVLALIAAFAFQHMMNALFQKDTPRKIPYLYMQQAQSGTLTPIEGQKDRYVLSLTGISPRTLFITNKPRRVVGSVSSERFLLGTWNTSTKGEYESNPPNAALTVYGQNNGAQSTMAVEIMNPSYSFATGTLSYTVKQLTGRDADTVGVETSGNAADFPREFSSPVLYIDLVGIEPEANNYLFDLSNLK
jgi:hypothetical protein